MSRSVGRSIEVAMDGWFEKLTQWFVDLVKAFFASLMDFVHDAFIWVFDSLLSAIATLIASIPAPDFLASNPIGSMLAGMPPLALYVISKLNLHAFFAIILAGVLFRLGRKILTLGQW
jgi:hypothetical protein